jgi:hypothetical protein
MNSLLNKPNLGKIIKKNNEKCEKKDLHDYIIK